MAALRLKVRGREPDERDTKRSPEEGAPEEQATPEKLGGENSLFAPTF